MAVTSCPNPSVINPLVSTGFVLQIVRFPQITLFCKSISLPSVNLSPAPQATRHMVLNHPGLIADIAQLQIEYTVDENMDNYVCLYDWITLISIAEKAGVQGDIQKFQEKYPMFGIEPHRYDADVPDLTSDMLITVFGQNSKPVRTITLNYCHPTNVEGFQIRDDTSETTYLNASASFAFYGKPIISDLITQQE